MKTLYTVFLIFGLATQAQAQSRVGFRNDSLHLVYWSTALPGPLGGQPYLLGQGGQTFTIELWAGISPSLLSIVDTTDFTGQLSPGTWIGRNVVMQNVPVGTNYFDVRIYDAAAGSWEAAFGSLGYYWGHSGVFTAVASGTIVYNSLVFHNSPAWSTWADGDYNMDFLSPGFRGAIMLTTGPEPSTFALSGLAITLLLLRRRNATKVTK